MPSRPKYRVLLPVVLGCIHLLFVSFAEIQYRTGWWFDPPGVAFDPPHLPLAERIAVYLNLPSCLLALALAVILFTISGATVEGLELLLLATPIVVGFWFLVGRWVDARSQRRRSII